MQELITQVEDLAGIEMNHTTSLVMIFGIIFLTAIIVHIILHWVVLRTFERRAVASSVCGYKLLRRISYFTVWHSPCRVLSSIFSPHCGCKKAAKPRRFLLSARSCGS